MVLTVIRKGLALIKYFMSEKSAKPGQRAERGGGGGGGGGGEVVLGKHWDTHTHRDHAVHVRLPSIQTRQNVEQAKAYFCTAENPTTHFMKPWKT